MRFHNRIDAGRQLALALTKFRGQDGIVCPLPRGGVELGVEIARVLAMPLDLVIPRKVGHPLNPEYAVCAVTEFGAPICNEHEIAQLDPAWLRQSVENERREARRRRERYLATRAPVPAEGKIVILVDDGIATGLTLRAAIQDIRARRPRRLIAAIPVAPKAAAEQLLREVDELFALDVPDFYLGAVGAYYDEFPQLSDDTVVQLLNASPPVN